MVKIILDENNVIEIDDDDFVKNIVVEVMEKVKNGKFL